MSRQFASIHVPAAVALVVVACARAPMPNAPASPAPQKASVRPCKISGVNEALRCGTYDVYENRDARTGRKISIAFTIAPATGPAVLPDAIVPIAGGPGDSVRRATAGFIESFATLRKQRDIVLIDVRGTGDSAPLDCVFPQASSPLGQLQQFLPADGVAACAKALAKERDLRQYTTRQIVDDLHEVLSALGYRQANLVGTSYGTRAALTFMRRHPRFVRTANLLATLPFGTFAPLPFARDAQAAVDGIFDECGREAACAAAFPDLRDGFAKILARLKRGAIDIQVKTKTGPQTEPLTRAAFVQTVRYMTYLSAAALELPLAVHLAAGGDFSIFARYGSLFGNFLSSSSDGLYLSVTCAEDVPFIADDVIAAAVENTFLGDYRIRQQRTACRHWPRAPIDDGFHEPLRSGVPTLLVSGALDPVTPASGARKTAELLTNRALLIVPNGGHDYVGLENTQCINRLEHELIRTGDARELDVESCQAAIRRPAFPTSAPAPAIAMSVDALSAYVGRYSSKRSPFKLAVTLENGRLMLAGLGSSPMAIEPTSETAFRFADLPPSFSVTFRLQDGQVSGLVMKSTGEPDIELERE